MSLPRKCMLGRDEVPNQETGNQRFTEKQTRRGAEVSRSQRAGRWHDWGARPRGVDVEKEK